MLLTAPQVPDPRIVKLAESGKPIKKGDVVIEFDGVQQEQNLIEKTTTVRTADSEIVQTKAQHKIENEMDGMNLMQTEYNVDRAKLEASKAEILSEIEGAKDRIDVGVSEGELGQVKTVNGPVALEVQVRQVIRVRGVGPERVGIDDVGCGRADVGYGRGRRRRVGAGASARATR